MPFNFVYSQTGNQSTNFSGFSPANQKVNTLTNLSLGKGFDYERVIFTFQEPLGNYTLKRDSSNNLLINFGQANFSGDKDLVGDHFVKKITLKNSNGNLLATVALDNANFELRDFLSKDKYSCIIDIKPTQEYLNKQIEKYQKKDLPPIFSLADELKKASDMLAKDSNSPDVSLLKDAISSLKDGNLAEGRDKLLNFKTTYPNSNLNDPAMFLLGDVYYALGDNKENDAQAVKAWDAARTSYPDSPLAPTAIFMLGEISLKENNPNLALGYYKLFASEYPNNPYFSESLIRAADCQLKMGLSDDVKTTVEPLISNGMEDYAAMAAYSRVAMADFLSGYYNQAAENFRNILEKNPEFYKDYPEMLYATGESYYYLNRPDLTKMFLLHALNLLPDSPKVPVMMARIGDACQLLGDEKEAISIYNAAKNNFPDTDGGMVSQLRLADMGSLHSFFKGDQIFDVLEYGTKQATVEMYKKIVASGAKSDLMPLAYLYIGKAYLADGDSQDAVKWFRDLLTKYPKSILNNETKKELNQALVADAKLLFELEQYKSIENLYSDNSSYLDGDNLTQFQKILVEAYKKLKEPDKALDLLKKIKPTNPKESLALKENLSVMSLVAGHNMEALKYLVELIKEFPEQRAWADMQLDQLEASLVEGNNQQAVADLLRFREMVTNEYLQKKALSDAISIELGLKNYTQAYTLMDEYIKAYPQDLLSPDYILTQAKIDKRNNQYDRAWDKMAQFRIMYPDDIRTPATILDQISDADKLKKFRDKLRFIALYRNLYPNDEKSKELLLDEADELWKMGDHEESEKVYKKFRELYPKDPNIGNSYFEEYKKLISVKQYDEAFKLADKFRTLYPNDPKLADLTLEEAKDLLAAGKVNDAYKMWDKFRTQFPNDPRTPELLLIQARQELKNGKGDKALSLFQEYIDSYPKSAQLPDVYLEMAAAESKLALYNKAYDTLNQFLLKFPKDPRAAAIFWDQADMAVKSGQLETAIKLYASFRENYPNDPKKIQSYIEEAKVMAKNNQLAQAIQLLEGVNDPQITNNLDYLKSLSELYLDDGRIEDWLKTQETILANDSSIDSAKKLEEYLKLAKVAQQLSLDSDEEKNLDKALENISTSTDAYVLQEIATAYQNLGRKDKYISVLQTMKANYTGFWQSEAERALKEAGVN